jgi:hypothetical protein
LLQRWEEGEMAGERRKEKETVSVVFNNSSAWKQKLRSVDW